jgi:hypothetical protein
MWVREQQDRVVDASLLTQGVYVICLRPQAGWMVRFFHPINSMSHDLCERDAAARLIKDNKMSHTVY